MESFFSRFKNALVLVTVLLAQTLALATQIRRPADPAHPDGDQVRLLRLWTLALVTPFERISHASGHGLRGAWANYIALRGTRQKNEALERELAAMRVERAALAEDALEGQRLRTLLGFTQHYIGSTVAAQVIGTSGSESSRLLTLDKGSQEGLRPEMPVITPDGVVGKLRDVFPHSSQLLLLDDPTSGAGALLASSRIRAVVHGAPGGKLEIGSLTDDPHIRTGEQVLTSGGDLVYPRGLTIGTIESIVPDPEHPPFTIVTLRPAANLSRLDEVLVVTTIDPSPSPEVQAELTQDRTSRTAQMSVGRLPTLNDAKPAQPEAAGATSTPTDTEAPPPENSTKLVPRPDPALHPDRYSPGTTPPASELTPGGRHIPAPEAAQP